MSLNSTNGLVNLYANGDLSLASGVTGFFLIVTAYGIEMGKVFASGDPKGCQFISSDFLFRVTKHSAVCAINVSKFDASRTHSISIQSEQYKHEFKVMFEPFQNDAIILSDVVKGTGWRGCKMSATNEQMNQRVYGWRHSLCPYGVCHIPTLNVELVDCNNLWRIRDLSDASYATNIYKPTEHQIHRGVFKAHLEPSELVKELTAKNFESQLKIVPVELGGNAVLPCRMDANLVGTVYKSDPVLFYFFTPQRTRVTRFVESPKYELEANTLEIKRVQREDAGLYYCVLQQRHSVTYGTSFQVRIKTCRDVGCNGTEICAELRKPVGSDYHCVPGAYFQSSTVVLGTISPYWTRILFWVLLLILFLVNILVVLFYFKVACQKENKEPTRKRQFEISETAEDVEM